MVDAISEKRKIAVFIASPGDLAEERDQFRKTVDMLNGGFGDGAGVAFEALGWEHTLASVGRRAQGLINAEIDRCHVFILVLNRRWGQKAPDSKFTSYTEEEFHRAFARWKFEGAPEIFVFFKRVDPASEADPGKHLEKVMLFRRTLENSRQVLYRYVDDAETFGQEVDRHLRAYAKGELPKTETASDITILPVAAIEAIKKAKEEARAAVASAEAANQQAEEHAARAEELALELAEDAAEAALEGKLEKARQRFAQALAGTMNIRILDLAYQFYRRTGDLPSAETLCHRWISLSPANSVDLAAAYGNLGNVRRTRGELDQAAAMYEKSLAINKALSHKEGIAIQYGNLGIVYQIRGELDKAKAMHEKALTIETELNRKQGMANQYGDLGNVHKTRGELDQAVAMYEKSLAINEELGHKQGMANQYGNLGVVHRIRGELDEAMAMHAKALAIDEELGRKQGMANQYGNLGNVHRARGELDEAVAMYEKAQAINKELHHKEGMAIQYGNLGFVHNIRGEIDRAREVWQQSLILFEDLRSPMADQIQQLMDGLNA